MDQNPCTLKSKSKGVLHVVFFFAEPVEDGTLGDLNVFNSKLRFKRIRTSFRWSDGDDDDDDEEMIVVTTIVSHVAGFCWSTVPT